MAQRRPVCGLSLPAGAGGRGEDIDHHRGRQAGTVWIFCPDKERRGGAVVMIGAPPARLDVDREWRLRWLKSEDINEPPIIGGDGVRDVPRHIPASDTRETIALLLVIAQRRHALLLSCVVMHRSTGRGHWQALVGPRCSLPRHALLRIVARVDTRLYGITARADCRSE